MSRRFRGFFVAAGFNAHGIAGAGGIGRIMAEWIVDGEPSMDAWEMDIRRFGDHYRSRRYTLERTRESLSMYYDISYPNQEPQSARRLRLSPAYERLEALGAHFGEKGGMGTSELLPLQRGPDSGASPAAGHGRTVLVHGDPGGASGRPGACRIVRPIFLREDRGDGVPVPASFCSGSATTTWTKNRAR